MNPDNGFGNWLKQNFITLLVLIAGLAMGYGILNARVQAMENKVAEYPSQDWFELKFDTIETRFNTLDRKVDGKVDINSSVKQ